MRPFAPFRLFSAVLIILLMHLGRACGQEAPPVVSADSAIVIDMRTATVLYEKNPDKKQYPASITKIMTAYLFLQKEKDLDRSVSVSRKAANAITPGSSSICLKPGEVVTLRNVMYGLMLKSANECANVVAEEVSGSIEDFTGLMNQTVKDWGLQNTHFMNPHGLHHKEHYTTARDMALIAWHAMSDPTFREIVSTRSFIFPDTNKHKSSERGELVNKNDMIQPWSGEYYEACIGIKGGYTTQSHHTFVTAAEKDGRGVIACVLREPGKDTMYRDLAVLMDYGLSQFEKRIVISRGDVVLRRDIAGGTPALEIAAADKLEADLPKDCRDIERKIDLADISLPVSKDAVLGKASFYFGGLKLGEVPLAAANNVVRSYSWGRIKRIAFSFPVLIGAGFLIALILFLAGGRKERRYG
jgi:serine-type D-Ala-D-Ala carboxypeptidase (penicillin-binding protein 5/6)